MNQTVVTVLAGAGGIVVATLTVWGTRKLTRGIRAVALFLNDWHGTPKRAGVPARPGVLAHLEAQDEKQAATDREVAILRQDISVMRGDMAIVKEVLRDDLGVMKEQLRPNGGDSMYDKVTRVAEAMEGNRP